MKNVMAAMYMAFAASALQASEMRPQPQAQAQNKKAPRQRVAAR
jgi:hypothetical protein